MTIIIPAHRALTTKLAGRSYQVVTRYGYNPWLARVNHVPTSNDEINSNTKFPSSHRVGLISTRTYATTTAKAPGRPKAHTGRTPARKTTKTAATAKKPGPKTAAGKSKVGRKPKPATKAKAKAKAKPLKRVLLKKPPSKTALNRKRIDDEKELREKALLKTPKPLPSSAWTVLFSESVKASTGSGEAAIENTKEAAAKYRAFTPEQKEHYNHIANQNKAKNETEFKKWLNSHTPEQIKEANNARRVLTAQWAAKKNKPKGTKKFPPLQDERQVKRPMTAFILFSMARRETGDYQNMTVVESSRLLGREWNALDAATKQQYSDQAKGDHNRYVEELKTVYGIDFKARASKAAA